MVSGGVWGVSGGCLVSVLGLLVVSGVCWVVSGGCFRHFFRSGHFVPPPHDIRESRTPCLIGLKLTIKSCVQINHYKSISLIQDGELTY